MLWGCGCTWCHQPGIWAVWGWRADLGSSEFYFCLDLDLGPCPVFSLPSPILARIWSQSTEEHGATRPALVGDHPQYLVTGLPSAKILWLVCLMGISLPGCLLLVIFWLLTTSLCLFAVNPQLSLLHSELSLISLLFYNSSEKSLTILTSIRVVFFLKLYPPETLEIAPDHLKDLWSNLTQCRESQGAHFEEFSTSRQQSRSPIHSLGGWFSLLRSSASISSSKSVFVFSHWPQFCLFVKPDLSIKWIV